MARRIMGWLVCGLVLSAAGPIRAEDKNSLENASVVGTITATQKVAEDIERSPIIGYITVGQTTIAVGVETKISDGPGDLVKRGFGSLQKGCKVEVVMGRVGKTEIATQINIVADPPQGK